VPDGARRVVFVQPLGDFKPTDRKIVKLASEYLALHFELETKILADVPLAAVPARARRKHPQWGDAQILTTHVLNEMLAPKLPADAAALIAFTPSDLWPGNGWNFVFGQADLRARVGVWSLYRNGDPDKSPEAFQLALLRALRIAVHETGHMFSLEHCTAYKCVQAGVNSLEEADRSPLWLCPECEIKVAWATRSEPVDRMKEMGVFCKNHGLAREAEFFAKELAALA
jgi:archaemetzincin